MATKIPITIITGFLGSGKTTLILNLIPQLPPNYKLALLKNEFGDVAIDSRLASSSAISGVQELLNGCICCNLVGQLADALEDLCKQISPDRIIIETSGSAFPATLAMEVNRIVRETKRYILDGVITMIDAENWQGYEDTSYTARLQARYTDLIVISKWELVSERRLEDCEDHILALEVDPPTPRTRSKKGWVDKDIIFGLDPQLSKLMEDSENTVYRHDHDHHNEVEVLSITLESNLGSRIGVHLQKLETFLLEPSKDEVYRIKAILFVSSIPRSSEHDLNDCSSNQFLSESTCFLLNWAFGRWTFTQIDSNSSNSLPPSLDTLPPSEETHCKPALRMTIITARGESSKWINRIEAGNFIALEDGSQGVLTIKKIL